MHVADCNSKIELCSGKEAKTPNSDETNYFIVFVPPEKISACLPKQVEGWIDYQESLMVSLLWTTI